MGESKIKPEEDFRLNNGKIITSLDELAEILKTMDENIFLYHVTKERNDFSNWVRDIFRETKLAEKLFNIESKEEMTNLLGRHLKKFSVKKVKLNIQPTKEPLVSLVKERIRPQSREKTGARLSTKKSRRTIDSTIMIQQARILPPTDLMTRRRLIACIRGAYAEDNR